MIIGNSVVALLYLLDSLEGIGVGQLPDTPLWASVVFFAHGIFSVVCLIALLKWKKWGFWGYVALSVVALCLNIALGLGLLSLLSLLSPAVLYGVLDIGEENKGWPQLG